MDRWVTAPKRVTSPTWDPSPPCKQALIAGILYDPCQFSRVCACLFQSQCFASLHYKIWLWGLKRCHFWWSWTGTTVNFCNPPPRGQTSAFCYRLRAAATFADEISTTPVKIQLGVRPRNIVSLICSFFLRYRNRVARDAIRISQEGGNLLLGGIGEVFWSVKNFLYKVRLKLAIDGFFLMVGSKAFHSANVLHVKVCPPSVFLVYLGQRTFKPEIIV